MNDNDEEKNGINNFLAQYGGAVIGGIVALILCFTELYKFLVYVIIVFGGMFVGNYVQKNKSIVKESLKSFIDRF